jgi:hypothetical protein
MSTRTKTNFWLDVASLIVMLGLILTGMVIYYVLPPGTGHSRVIAGLNRHDIGRWHFYLGVTAVLAVAIHVVLHWSWVCCIVSSSLGRCKPSSRVQTAWGLAVFAGVAGLIALSFGVGSSLVEPVSGQRAPFRERASSGALPSTRSERPAVEMAAVIPAPVSSQSDPEPDRRHARHEHRETLCVAGRSVSGRTTLSHAATAAGVSAARLCETLGLPRGMDPRERLGRLKRRHGLSLHDVRKLVCAGQ